jgi:hypothetical protein
VFGEGKRVEIEQSNNCLKIKGTNINISKEV